MANETEVMEAQEEEQQPEAAAAEQPETAPEEAEKAAEPAAEEEEAPQRPPKRDIKKLLGGVFKALVVILMVFIVVFEALMVYLWLRYDTIYPEQSQPSTSGIQQNRTTSAYANWGGFYRPEDWPDAVSSFASLPSLDPAEEPESGEAPAP